MLVVNILLEISLHHVDLVQISVQRSNYHLGTSSCSFMLDALYYIIIPKKLSKSCQLT